MPHVRVEFSRNLESLLDVRDLVGDLHRTMIGSGLFDVATIRTRALPHDVYRIAEGDGANVFVHVAVRIKAGRSVAARQRLGGALLDVAKAAFAVAPPTPVALSVEIEEIDPAMLFRHITIA